MKGEGNSDGDERANNVCVRTTRVLAKSWSDYISYLNGSAQPSPLDFLFPSSPLKRWTVYRRPGQPSYAVRFNLVRRRVNTRITACAVIAACINEHLMTNSILRFRLRAPVEIYDLFEYRDPCPWTMWKMKTTGLLWLRALHSRSRTWAS